MRLEGNIYDPDLDNNLIVQAADLAVFKPLFFTTDPHADFDVMAYTGC